MLILTLVRVSVSEEISSIPMFQHVEPFTFIFIAILPEMNPVAFSLVILPLPYVAISEYSSPYTVTLLLPLTPFTIVHLSFRPFVDPFSMGFVVLELAFIQITRLIAFVPFAMPLVILPFTLIKALVIMIDHDSETMPLPIF
jgi:hypothetical protein